MILDTGAQITTLTTQAAERLWLHLEALHTDAEGIGGSRSAYAFVAPPCNSAACRAATSVASARIEWLNFEAERPGALPLDPAKD